MKLMTVTRMMMVMSFLTATDLVLHGKVRMTALPVFLMLFATCSRRTTAKALFGFYL